jgi:hypothetical protein
VNLRMCIADSSVSLANQGKKSSKPINISIRIKKFHYILLHFDTKARQNDHPNQGSQSG